LSLSSDKKQVIGVASFTSAYDVSGKIARYDDATRTLSVYTQPDAELVLPVAADAKVMVNGEAAKITDVKKGMRVLIRRSDDRKTITGVVAVTDLVALPEPNRK
jgi:hypothetical protein